MKIKIFTLRLDLNTGTFNDQELVNFQLDKDIIDISEHYLDHEKIPTLVIVLRYREIPASGSRPSLEVARKEWRAELDVNGKKIYDELRIWRGRRAKRDGMPPYLIFNNREMAELAMKRPASLAQLQSIEGIGEAKSKRWGEEILALLAKLASSPQAQGDNPQAGA